MSLWCTPVRLHGARGHPPGRSQCRLSGSLKHSPLPLLARRLTVRANIPHGNYRTYSECLATKKLSHVSREVTQKSNKPSPTLKNPAVNSRRCATLHQSQHIPLAAEAGNLCDAIKGERGPFLRNRSVSAFCSAISVRSCTPRARSTEPAGLLCKGSQRSWRGSWGGGPGLGLQRLWLRLPGSVSYSKGRKKREGKEQTRNRAGRGESRRAGPEEGDGTGEPASLPGPAG